MVRIRIISGIIFLFALLLLGRLYMIQIVSGDELSLEADRQYVQTSTLLFDRGSIYFTSKDGQKVPAATLKTGFVLTINPSLITDPESTYEKLSDVMSIDRENFLRRAARTNDPYEEIAHRLDDDIAKAIEELDLRGVHLYKERWRYYPGNHIAAHTLGFVAYDEDVLVGQYGLERAYEEVLRRGENNVYVNFFAEMFSNIRETLTYSRDKEADIITTIEPNVEAYLENVISDLQSSYEAGTTGGIIINPKTGEVLAMAAAPTFDPNTFSEVENGSVFRNPLVESVYEMGSIIKPLTVAAGLDARAITPQTTYDDQGFLELNGYKISNFDGRGRGVVDMQEVLSQSLNTGAAFIASTMGRESFSKYFLNFGLGEPSGIDLPNDAAGLVKNLNSPREIEHATASYGQGIAMSPIVTVKALSAIANGGKLVTPHVVKTIDYSMGLSENISTTVERQVLRPETSEEVSRMLVRVVDEALLEGSVKLPNYSVAAKTGTAQIANPNGGGYYEDRYLHSFFGYFPAYDPEFLVFLYTVNPKGVRYASQTLTHPFIDITKFLINYYEVPPDR